MTTPLFAAYTIDGGLIFGSDSRAAFLEKIGTHIRENRKPHVGYEYDSRQHPKSAFPYTVWRLTDAADVAGIVGTPCRTFEEVCKAWGKI